MIDDFDATKKKLAELADVVNKFKSESVQLRIVEFVLGSEVNSDNSAEAETKAPRRRKRNKSTKPAAPETTTTNNGASSEKPSKSRRGGTGAVATLNEMVDDGFFKSKRTIGDIVKHCEEKKARRFKANEFSGALGRKTRDGTLDREKNKDGQYEYKQQ